MPNSGNKGEAPASEKDGSPRQLSEAARRALAEAESRRANPGAQRPKELRGREGPDPVRYGDWEIKGIAADF